MMLSSVLQRRSYGCCSNYFKPASSSSSMMSNPYHRKRRGPQGQQGPRQHQIVLFSSVGTETKGGGRDCRGGLIIRGDENAIGFKQMFDDESSTYTYLLWDEMTKDAVLVDPVDTQVDRDLSIIDGLGLNLVFGINTHAHADHITGTGLLKQKVSNLQSIISQSSGADADIKINDGDRIVFGTRSIQARSTPGHTGGCLSYVADDQTFVLTGDALLIQGCGRTDFQGGSAATLYDSVHEQIFSLPDTTVVYPAHDYKSRTASTVGDEKRTNPRLGSNKSKEEFIDIMANLQLSYPKKIDVAVPANMRCGIPDAS